MKSHTKRQENNFQGRCDMCQKKDDLFEELKVTSVLLWHRVWGEEMGKETMRMQRLSGA